MVTTGRDVAGEVWPIDSLRVDAFQVPTDRSPDRPGMGLELREADAERFRI